MQTRNKKYCVNANILKSKENQKDECLRLSESSEMIALKDLENKENLQTRSVLQSKENHLPGAVTSMRSKVRNEINKLGKRRALKSKENNLKEKPPTFSKIDNYDFKLQSRGISGKNEENKENFFINNSTSKTKGKENVEFKKITLPLRRRGKIDPEVMINLNKNENVKELKYEERVSDSKALRRENTEGEVNNKDQGFRIRDTSRINNPLLPIKRKLSIKLTPLKFKEGKISDLRKRDDAQCNDDQTRVLNKDVSKLNETLESCRENKKTLDEKTPVANEDDALPIRAPSIRVKNKKNTSAGTTDESNIDKTTGSDKNVSKMNETPNSGIESTETKHVEKPSSVNKGNALPIRAPSTRIRCKKNNSGGSTQESNLDTIVSDKNVSKMNETPNLGIENTDSKHVEKSSCVTKGNILPKRTLSARIKSKKPNLEGSTELSNPEGTIDSVKNVSKESETAESSRENKKLKVNGKTVVNKSDALLKKASARIRSQKSNSESGSQQANLNGNAIVSNENTNISETLNEKIPVVKINILPNRLPSKRIRNQKTNSMENVSNKANSQEKIANNTNSQENVSNDKGKKLQFSENLSNQSRLQEKVPVWKCKEVKKSTESNSPIFDFKTKRRSNRVSLSRKRDVYEFSFEGNEKYVIKKKRRKQQIRKKKLKPLKKGMLTTDPLFQPTIPSITTKTFYSSKIAKSGSQKPCNEQYNENHENNNSFDGEDTNFVDVTVDDAGYEASISVAESSCMSHINPVISALPTPEIYSRFVGPASTPVDYDERYGYNSIVKSKNIPPQEQVKLCFGFDESDDENTSIGLSPVQNFNQFSYLQHSSHASYNVEENESAPTRFTLPTFKKPLPLMNGKENTQLKLKKRCTSTKINHAKRRKLDKNSIVPDKDSLPLQAQDNNVSVLFDVENEVPVELNTNDVENPNKRGDLKRLQLPLNVQESNASILFDKENEAPLESNRLTNDANRNKSGDLKRTLLPEILSPEKRFSKPPRKSYDRRSLEAARKKFIEDFAGGYPTTDAGSDYEDPEPPYVRKRKKRMESQKENSIGENSQSKFRLVSKRTNKACKKNENKEKQISDVTVNKKHVHIKKKPTKNQIKPEDDWVSDINSHFSEIEDIDLLIE